MLVAEYFEPDASDTPASDDSLISVGKVQMEELSVDKLTVAGTELSGDGQRSLDKEGPAARSR
jgi:hypothetical protein